MKQVVQHLKSGVLEVVDVPCPQASAGQLLIQTRASLISAGTERSVVEFGQSSMVRKVRDNPDRVKQVLDRIRNDGLLPTLELVFAKLDEPMPLGYSNVGVVVGVGAGVEGFAIGDRVVSNGRHAEMVAKPVNLCVKVPEHVTSEQATFTLVSSIGLQGLRLLKPELGEKIAVFGLGLIGLLAVQMLVGSGAEVIGIDVDPGRLALARKFGATTVDLSSGADPVAAGMAFSAGQGVDGVLITASAKNDSIVSQAANMSRKRGRIVLVGVVNMELSRAEFYEKELSFQVSCSYGPGRYDPTYEEQGIDYPYAFVRWTEKRNMEAVLGMLAAGRLDIESLITSRIPQADAAQAYAALSEDRSQIGIILEYPDVAPPTTTVIEHRGTGATATPTKPSSAAQARVGVIGAGNYTKIRLLPEIKRTSAVPVSIASASGVTAAHAARKFGFETSTTDYRQILDNPRVDAVFITTRHHQHVPMAIDALRAGKHVFVEKPLAIDAEGLARIREVYEQTTGLELMVGFNRRFSGHAAKIRQLLASRSQPATLNMLVNAGYIPGDHWMHDPRIGGGRIIGEGCHWFDLLRYVVDAPIVAVQAAMIGDVPGVETRDDNMSVSLLFADGSLGNLHYFANGHKSYTKEKLEVYCEGRTLLLDNFRKLTGYGWSNFKKLNYFSQDKGRRQEISGFIDRVARGGAPLIPPSHLWNVTAATFAAMDSARSGQRVELAAEDRG
ncbi:MAG: bi-domain-containing oxidoreductase [Pirellulales bacterium]|nr:bi-domain-containing oxidoreductase [Pirellulales bacterium]